MEIKGFGGVVNAYKNNTVKNQQKKPESSSSKKMDRMEFNAAGLVESAKSGISASINTDASSERIEQLKAAIANGEYKIDSKAVADAILSLE